MTPILRRGGAAPRAAATAGRLAALFVALAGCGPIEAECWTKLETTGAEAVNWNGHTPYECRGTWSSYSSDAEYKWNDGHYIFSISVVDVVVGQTGYLPATVSLFRGSSTWSADASHCSANIGLDAPIDESEYRQVRGEVQCNGGLGGSGSAVLPSWPVAFASFYSPTTSYY